MYGLHPNFNYWRMGDGRIIMFNLQTTIGGIQLLIPNVGGIATGGVLSVIAFGISMVFTVMVVVWVALSIYAGIRIITSAAEPDGIEAGKKTITNIWIGIAMFLGFLVVLSVVGAFTGIGDIYSWHTNLAQCGGTSGQFMFQYLETDETLKGYSEDDFRQNVAIGCCKVRDGQEWQSLVVNDITLNEYRRWEQSCENISSRWF